MKIIVLTVLVAWTIGITSAAEVLAKSALLIMPAEIEHGGRFEGRVALRWDEDAPLEISVWKRGVRESVIADVSVFDEDDHEIEMIYPVSLPTVPNGRRTVAKGELLELELDFSAFPIFRKRGSYYAVARFSWAESGECHVMFTTKKRWFTVLKATQMPNQALQRNAGGRPSSDDSPASETPSSLGPRGSYEDEVVKREADDGC